MGKQLINLDDLEANKATSQRAKSASNRRWATWRKQKELQQQTSRGDRNGLLERIIDDLYGITWTEQETIEVFSIMKALRSLKTNVLS